MDMIGFKKLVLPALPGLDVRKADVELFRIAWSFFYFAFFFVFLERGNRLVHG
jgi:hypothetical protein